MATLTIPQLSLALPSSRMSVDFATFATNPSVPSVPLIADKSFQPSANKALPPIQDDPKPPTNLPLSIVEEESDVQENTLSRQPSTKWRWKKSKTNTNILRQQSIGLSRTNSNASTATDSSTGTGSVFSSVSSASTASSERSFQAPRTSLKGHAPLLSLPLSLLEHIATYVLELPQTVVLGPLSKGSRHMQHRYNREALEHLELRQVLTSPILRVSQRMRAIGLDVLYRRSNFSVDLASIYYTRVSSTVDDNLKKHTRFWTEAPETTKSALQALSRLQVRVPVPSTEAGVHRGREENDWMEGSDGNGGGSWHAKSMRREQQDALDIQRCLEMIAKLVLAERKTVPEPQSLTRSLSLSRSRSTRADADSRLLRSKSAQSSRSDQTASPTPNDRQDDKRKPLKRLEIVLVKRASQALVLTETLGIIRIVRPLQVSGFTHYMLELDGQRFVWATKYKKRWQGMEPDGSRLLQDLQGLKVAERPVEPICTPTAFKFVDVDRKGRLKLSDSAMPKTPLTFDTPQTALEENDPLPTSEQPASSIRRKPVAAHIRTPAVVPIKKARERHDSFGLVVESGLAKDPPPASKGFNIFKTKVRREPPTVDELRKIADDIRNGKY